jgi:hypothetical protein
LSFNYVAFLLLPANHAVCIRSLFCPFLRAIFWSLCRSSPFPSKFRSRVFCCMPSSTPLLLPTPPLSLLLQVWSWKTSVSCYQAAAVRSAKRSLSSRLVSLCVLSRSLSVSRLSCLYVALSLCPFFVSLSIFLFASLSLYLCLSVFVCIALSFALSLSPSLSLSLSISMSSSRRCPSPLSSSSLVANVHGPCYVVIISIQSSIYYGVSWLVWGSIPGLRRPRFLPRPPDDGSLPSEWPQ